MIPLNTIFLGLKPAKEYHQFFGKKNKKNTPEIPPITVAKIVSQKFRPLVFASGKAS
jgi:hypothetical protein